MKRDSYIYDVFFFPANALLADYPLAIPASTMSKMTQDAKKDEFRKYLEKAGVLELLTKSLVQVSPVECNVFCFGYIDGTM